MNESIVPIFRLARTVPYVAALSICAIIVGFVGAFMPVFAGPHIPFSASGTILTIDTGDVRPAGQSGRFIVRDRHITGTPRVLSAVPPECLS